VALQPLVGQGLLTIEVSRSHSDTPLSVGLLQTRVWPGAQTYTCQHNNRKRHTSMPPIRTRDPSKRQAAGPRLRPRGHIIQVGTTKCNGLKHLVFPRFAGIFDPSRSSHRFSSAVRNNLDYCFPARWFCGGDPLHSKSRPPHINTLHYLLWGKGENIKFHPITCHEDTGWEM
jgi:hypothetical protein